MTDAQQVSLTLGGWPDQLSPHFTTSELIHSETAEAHHLDNTPDPSLIGNAQRLAALLEVVRELLSSAAGKDMPLIPNSGFRSIQLNTLVRGSGWKAGQPLSAHCDFRALDFHLEGMALDHAFSLILNSPIRFDKLLIEHNAGGGRWIHIQVPKDGWAARRMAFAASVNAEGEVVYTRVMA